MLKSYTQKQRNTLIALVTVPVALILLPHLSHLLFNRYDFTVMIYEDSFLVIQLLLCITTTVCIGKKKWKFLWPLLFVFGVPFLSALLDFVRLALAGLGFFTVASILNLGLFTSALSSMASEICLFLTPLLVACHFQQKETQLRKAYEVFSKREKRILVLLAVIPLVLLLLPELNYLMRDSSAPVFIVLRNIVDVTVSYVLRSLLFAIIIYCALKKQFKILWPLLVFVCLRILPDILRPLDNLLMYIVDPLPYEESKINPTPTAERIYWFSSAFINSFSSIAQHTSIWLTPYLVARYFKNKSQLLISEGETHA